jgi:transposase
MEASLREKVLEGPSQEEGLVRYRIVDFQEFLKEKHGVSLGISTIWGVLRKLGCSWKTGRQRHPKSHEEIQERCRGFQKSIRTNG